MVGLVLRSSPALLTLRELIRDPASGRIMNVVFRDDQYIPTQGMYASTWRGDRLKAGSGTHARALDPRRRHPRVAVRSAVDRCRRRTANFHGLDGIEDSVAAVLGFEGGHSATLTSVWHDVLARPSQRRMEVFCEHALLTLGGDAHGPVSWERDDDVGAVEGEAMSDWLTDRGVVVEPAENAFLRALPRARDASRRASTRRVVLMCSSTRCTGPPRAVVCRSWCREARRPGRPRRRDAGSTATSRSTASVSRPSGSAAVTSDLVAAPGFVDRQVNGFAGIDLRGADEAGYAAVASSLAAHGATAFCPTFYSTTPRRYLDALADLASVHRAPPRGARVLGAHLEGPFLSRRWAGAHDPRTLLEPDLELTLHASSAAAPSRS